MTADRYSWEVDEWREKFLAVESRLDTSLKEYEFHVSKLERTVAWLTVRLQETVTYERTPDRFVYVLRCELGYDAGEEVTIHASLKHAQSFGGTWVPSGDDHEVIIDGHRETWTGWHDTSSKPPYGRFIERQVIQYGRDSK